MSYSALVAHFSKIEDLPIPVDDVINWIRESTEHKNIKLHEVGRDHKAFRGAFRQTAMPSIRPYNIDPEILNCVLYGADLDEDWKRLVIVKEVLHVFDLPAERVNTQAAVEELIPAMIFPEMRGTPFAPAINDKLGPFKALLVLIPEYARIKLQKAFHEERRTIEEIAHYCKLPTAYVDFWMRKGEEVAVQLLK